MKLDLGEPLDFWRSAARPDFREIWGMVDSVPLNLSLSSIRQFLAPRP